MNKFSLYIVFFLSPSSSFLWDGGFFFLGGGGKTRFAPHFLDWGAAAPLPPHFRRLCFCPCRTPRPGAKYLFPNRFIYGAVLSLWTQRLMNIHDIQSLPFIPSIHHWLQRLDRGVLVKHCSAEPKDGSSSPHIANNLLPYLWILDNLFGRKKKSPPGRRAFCVIFEKWALAITAFYSVTTANVFYFIFYRYAC